MLTCCRNPLSQLGARPLEVLVYTCGNRGYEQFAPLFIAGALWTSDLNSVEFGVPDLSAFDEDPAIQFLHKKFPGRFSLTQVDFPPTVIPHAVRFLTTPQRKARNVYIVDSDLVLLDQTFPNEHLKFMQSNGLPYANSVRPDSRRMTGLHFSRWDAYYPLPDISDLNLMMNDERLLAEIVHRKGLPLHREPWFRPVPGIHPSPNREPMGSAKNGKLIPGWGVQPWMFQWARFRSDLSDLMPLLAGKSAETVKRLDGAVGRNPARTTFTRVFNERKAAGAESVCGTGSTVAATAKLLPQLKELLDRHGIKSLNDAPCGDFNWIGSLAQRVKYAGFDLLPEMVELAQSRSSHSFEVLDIASDVLPRADAILCRDCLVHLPERMIAAAIRNFVASESCWLISTTFPDLPENRKSSMGGWRPINLTAAPFSFPDPVEIIFERPNLPPHPDYGRKALGMWRLADLPLSSGILSREYVLTPALRPFADNTLGGASDW